MKREHYVGQLENYVFYYPFEANGGNFGANGLSNCFKRMMAYGSGNAEPNFSDTLSFTNFDGKNGVDVGSLSMKPVAKIEGADLNEILNSNDFELGIDYVYRGSYNEYESLITMCRNAENTKSNGLNILTGACSYNYAEWIDETNRVHTSTVRPANNVWHSFMARKTGSTVQVVVERLDNETVVLNQTLSWVSIPKTNPTDCISVLGDYFPNANKSHNVRWTNGMAKDLYLKIL